MPLKLKLDDAGHVVVADGKPVFVDDDGKDRPFDANATLAKIGQLNKEAQTHREAKEALEQKMTAFADIDPEAAKTALATVASLSAGELKTAKQVQEIEDRARQAAEQRVSEGVKTVTTKLEKAEAEKAELFKALAGEKISNAFATSKFISDKLALPAAAVQKIFGDHFSLEEGKIVAKGPDGRPIISKKNPGDLADTEEALELLVDGYSYRDHILKGTGNSGSGKKSNDGTANGKTMSRGEFDKLDGLSQATKMREGYTLTD